MKTIVVKFSPSCTNKLYVFRTEEDLEVGDVLSSGNYSSNIVVERILDEEYKFVNKITGELTNTYNSTNLADIKVLKLEVKDSDVVYASRVSLE